MAEYMLLLAGDEDGYDGLPRSEIGSWWDAHTTAGLIVGGRQLASSKTATTLRWTDRGPVVTDGPFVESKAVVGGFAIIDVPDLDAAIALAKTWPARGTIEIRPVIPNLCERELEV